MTPVLATVPALPITPALATVPALPITPVLLAVPVLPTTPGLSGTDDDDSTIVRRDSTSTSGKQRGRTRRESERLFVLPGEQQE
jgi:hypothetical protein